jgi:cysteine desulfurase/selenocysteine lyase
VDYLESIGLERIAAAEQDLLDYATQRLATIPGLTLVGTAPTKAAVVSFTVDGVHPHDLGTILDHEGVAIRTGHHCAMPVMEFFGLPATARASFAFYNTRPEVDRLVEALQVAREMLG